MTRGNGVRITWRGFALFAAWFAAMALIGTWAVKRYLIPGSTVRTVDHIELPAIAPAPAKPIPPRISARTVRAGIAEVQRSIDAPRLPQGVSQPDFTIDAARKAKVKCIDGWLYAVRTIDGVHHIELATRQNKAIPCTYAGNGEP